MISKSLVFQHFNNIKSQFVCVCVCVCVGQLTFQYFGPGKGGGVVP